MIITQTPLRIGIVGGGSDLPSFHKEHEGCCVNVTIDKYVYVLVKKRFDKKIYLKYSENEIVDKIEDIKHDFIRETLKFLKIDFGVEIINWADIPTKGTGLGSSSSFVVGLLHALHVLRGELVSKEQLANEACKIEILKCKKDIGYQDQFCASYGGMNLMNFKSGFVSATHIQPIKMDDNKLLNLSKNFMAFYTGFTRDSTGILTEQSKSLKDDDEKIQMMLKNVELAKKLHLDIQNGNFNTFGQMMNENWMLKRQFHSGISNTLIDLMYDKSIELGATGGKITGAGGGGFLILYAEQRFQEQIKSFLTNLSKSIEYMPIKFDPYGSRVLINVEEYTWG